MKILDFMPFDKIDFLFGLFLAAFSAVKVKSLSFTLISGFFGLLICSSFRDYFAIYRIRATVSLLFDRVKDKFFPHQRRDFPYNPAPSDHPYISKSCDSQRRPFNKRGCYTKGQDGRGFVKKKKKRSLSHT